MIGASARCASGCRERGCHGFNEEGIALALRAPLDVEALELVRWALNTGSIAKFISIPGVRAEGLSMGSWEISVRRIE